ncbi:hypothetical protein HAX54_013744 [Datura stramonium]|uniref:Uncharacterized protein n=1 Tax=Datura stramonium TaxID=4076 RepID=A0ABS8TNK8_DATST|nr:hypothetical protein [Datura stramonium]
MQLETPTYGSRYKPKNPSTDHKWPRKGHVLPKEYDNISMIDGGIDSDKKAIKGMTPKKDVKRGGKSNPQKRSRLMDQPSKCEEEYHPPKTRAAKKLKLALSPAVFARMRSAATPS